MLGLLSQRFVQLLLDSVIEKGLMPRLIRAEIEFFWVSNCNHGGHIAKLVNPNNSTGNGPQGNFWGAHIPDSRLANFSLEQVFFSAAEK